MPTGYKEAVKRFVQHPGTTTRPGKERREGGRREEGGRKERSWEGEGMGKGQLKRAGMLFLFLRQQRSGHRDARTSKISWDTTTLLSLGTASLEGCRE